MKKTLIFISVILSVLFLLIGCSNSKQNNKNVETTDAGTVKVGKYLGKPYKLTSSFIPILTIENGNKSKLELGVGTSIEGTYTIDNNRLVLVSYDGDENYTFGISNNSLIIKQEISNIVKKGTNFKLSGKE